MNGQDHDPKQEIAVSEMFSLFLHQDNLMWSRLQTIGVIQIGALGAGYGLRSTAWLSLSVLALGVALMLVILALLKRDQLIRDKIERQMGALEYTVRRTWYAPLRGREATWVVLGLLLAADITLAVAIAWGLLT